MGNSRNRSSLPAIVGVVLAIGLVLQPAAADPEFRAVWADAFSVGFKSSSQISTLVGRAVQGNYNVIIAEVLAYHDAGSGAHGAYWNSSIVPKATDISGGIDPLAGLVAQAHAVGIEVHAWIVPYRVSTSWPPSGNATLSAHPEWLMVPQADMDGGPAKVGSVYVLDPGSPGAQEYLVSIVQELVSNYAIDGINLDYIRYTQTDAGYPADASYDASSLARFQQITGYVGTPNPTGVSSWNDFRRQTISEFVRRLRAEIPAITSNPSQPVNFSADLIAFGNAPVSFVSTDAYALFQNWEHWTAEGWLDTAIPMNYKREYDAAQAAWYRNWVDAAIGWAYDRHVVAGQGNYLNRKADSVTQMAYALNAGSQGTCNFAYDATADENINGTPEADWTWYTYVSSNLFTSAVATPALTWRDPNLAVEGTLWGRVTDDVTGEPIDDALVTVAGAGDVRTDGNGYYVHTLLPAAAGGSNYTVSAYTPGCDFEQQSVLVTRAGLTRRDFVMCDVVVVPGDMNQDGSVDIGDWPSFQFCLQGPDAGYAEGTFCLRGDVDLSLTIDMIDLGNFQDLFGE